MLLSPDECGAICLHGDFSLCHFSDSKEGNCRARTESGSLSLEGNHPSPWKVKSFEPDTSSQDEVLFRCRKLNFVVFAKRSSEFLPKLTQHTYSMLRLSLYRRFARGPQPRNKKTDGCTANFHDRYTQSNADKSATSRPRELFATVAATQAIANFNPPNY